MLPGLSSIRHSDGSDWLSSCPLERGKGTDSLALRKAVPPFFACLQPLKGPKMCPEGQLAPKLERCEAAIWFNPSLQKWNVQAINPIFSGRKPATRARWSRDHRPRVVESLPRKNGKVPRKTGLEYKPSLKKATNAWGLLAFIAFVAVDNYFRVAACGGNYSGRCKAMYHTLLEGVWLSGFGRMAEVRNVPHLAARCQ